MKIDIKIPSLGESISEVTIGQIFISNGSNIKVDGEILEMETDKVNQVLYSPKTGKVTLNVKTGDSVQVGQTIGFIEESGDQKIEESQAKEEKIATSPEPKEITNELPKENQKAEKGIKKEKPATEGHVERLQKDEFVAELKSFEPILEKNPESNLNEDAKGERETRRPLSKIRKVIANRLVEAQQTTAMLTTFNEVDMTPIMQLREKYKEAFLKKYGSKLGLMSFFVKAVVSALQAFPDLNSYIDGEYIVRRNYYDIGVAVGTEKGVIVPIIRDCNHLSYAVIEQTLENFAKKARDGKLALNDLQGGGFTITNGGTYGSLLSTPILTPPQCGILGMHKIEKRPVVINDVITIRSMMYLALSYDHRIIDGKEAVSFLVHIKNVLEDSSRLILEI